MFRLYRCPPRRTAVQVRGHPLEMQLPSENRSGAPAAPSHCPPVLPKKALPDHLHPAFMALVALYLWLPGTHAGAQEIQATDPTSQLRVEASDGASNEDANSADSGMEGSLEVAPVASEGAFLDETVNEKLALDSQDSLRSLIPQAFLFRVASGAVYTDNIFQSEMDKESAISFNYLLGARFQGTKEGRGSFSLEYNATGFTHLENEEFDGINHMVQLTAGLSLPKTKLALSAVYQRVQAGEQLPQGTQNSAALDSSLPDTSAAADQRVSETNREVGVFQLRDVVSAAMSADRELAPKTNLRSNFAYSSTLYEDETLQSSQNVSAQLAATYQFTGKTTLGLAGTFGYSDNGDNGAQTYQNLQLTANYNASGKLAFRGSAGVELRQYGKPDPVKYEVDNTTQTQVAPAVAVAAVEPTPATATAPVAAPATTSTTAPPPTTPATASAAAPSNATLPPVQPAAAAVAPSTTPAVADTAATPIAAPSPTVTPSSSVPETKANSTTSPVNDYTRDDVVEQEDTTRFIFSLAATYQIRVRTALILSATRGTDGSAIAGVSSVERTNLALGIDQSIGRRFKLGLAGGYELANYTPAGFSENQSPVSSSEAGSSSSLEREEKYWFARATLNFAPTPRTTMGVFYELRNNDSGNSGLTYEVNRIGVQCAINF